MRAFSTPPGLRFPNTFPPWTPSSPLPRLNFYRYSTRTPLLLAPSTSQLPVPPLEPPPDAIEAVLACDIKGNFNADKEKMNAIQVLTRAAKNVEKKTLTGLKGKYYVNGKGSMLLGELAGLKRASAESKNEIAALKKEQFKMAEWAATIQPIQETSIAIRKRLFLNYCKMIDGPSWQSTRIIRKLNKFAHDGNFLTDSILMRRGDLDNTAVFCDLYGVPYENAQFYLESDMIVRMINTRATMLLNPGSSGLFRGWDDKLQIDFESVLSYFKIATRAEWARFEKDDKGDSPEREAWRRVVSARHRTFGRDDKGDSPEREGWRRVVSAKRGVGRRRAGRGGVRK